MFFTKYYRSLAKQMSYVILILIQALHKQAQRNQANTSKSVKSSHSPASSRDPGPPLPGALVPAVGRPMGGALEQPRAGPFSPEMVTGSVKTEVRPYRISICNIHIPYSVFPDRVSLSCFSSSLFGTVFLDSIGT
jgi:hypothetical protein